MRARPVAGPAIAARPPVRRGEDRLELSAAGRLAAGNKLALVHAGRQLADFARHPVAIVGATLRGLYDSVRHPARTAARIAGTFATDPMDGIIQTSQFGSLALAIGSLGLMGGSFALAPFTAGASLAWLPLAGTLGAASAAAGAGGLLLSVGKNEADLLRARTSQDLDAQARELGGDLINLGILAAAGGAGRAFRGAYQGSRFARKVNPASLKRVSGRANAGMWAHVKRRFGFGPRPPEFVGTAAASAGTLKARAALEVGRYLDRNPLGRRRISKIVDVGDQRALGPGWRLAYHGTQEKFAPAIRKGGLKPSDIGDYGSGIYLGSKPEVAINYADDAYLAHPGPGNGIVYSVAIEPGRVLDFLAAKRQFLAWAKRRFNPGDASDPLNRLYAGSRTSVSPLVDVRWTRYVNRYMAEKGYDSVLIRHRDAIGADYWMIPDPARVRVLQEIHFPQPSNRTALANGILGALAPLTRMRLRTALPLLRPRNDKPASEPR
ncbi:MAG: hypothetical protein FJZ01_13825 [Candidatus Sericytochromatia bacterium]|nr:hypothetical protein [Candidatus Tanganyikabacteria bacterium]